MAKHYDDGTVLQAKRFYADIDEAIYTSSGSLIQGSKTSYKEAVGGGLETLAKADSKILRQNLIDAGVEVPDYANAAHHIVAGNSAKAAEARASLQKY
jgi:hypothetical protein